MTRSETPTPSIEHWRWCLVLAASVGAFIGIAAAVVSGTTLTVLDRDVAQRLLLHGPAAWTEAMEWLARLHGVAGVAVVGTLWAAWLWHRGEKNPLARLALIVGGGLALNGFMKLLFQRARPTLDVTFVPLLDTPATYSFPSGHVAGSVVFYGCVLMLVFARTTHRGFRFAAVLAAGTMVMLIAYNRVYLGAHFASDVFAALAEGLAWIAFCALLLTRLRM